MEKTTSYTLQCGNIKLKVQSIADATWGSKNVTETMNTLVTDNSASTNLLSDEVKEIIPSTLLFGETSTPVLTLVLNIVNGSRIKMIIPDGEKLTILYKHASDQICSADEHENFLQWAQENNLNPRFSKERRTEFKRSPESEALRQKFLQQAREGKPFSM